MRELIMWNIPWSEIPQQDWPSKIGTIFVLKLHSKSKHHKQWGVYEWVESEIDHVLGLGDFWQKEDALIFAKAKSETGFQPAEKK